MLSQNWIFTIDYEDLMNFSIIYTNLVLGLFSPYMELIHMQTNTNSSGQVLFTFILFAHL